MSNRPRCTATQRIQVHLGLRQFPVGSRVRVTTGAHRGAYGVVEAHNWPRKGFLSVQFDHSRLPRAGSVDGVAVNADAASEALIRLTSEPTGRCSR